MKLIACQVQVGDVVVFRQGDDVTGRYTVKNIERVGYSTLRMTTEEGKELLYGRNMRVYVENRTNE